MKTLTRIALSTLLLLVAATAFAQDKAGQSAPDRIKLGVGFSNSEYANLLSTEYQQGLTAELDARIFRRDRFRLGGVFQYNRANLSADTPVDTYSFGPRLSVKFGPIEPFGQALFGLTTTYNDDRAFTRTYGLGADINLGHIYLRPFALDFLKFESAPGAVQRYGAGVGVRF
jgi:hypothetical protein